MATAAAERLAELAPAFQAELARRHVADFCALLDPRYECAPHTRLICEHLEALERGVIRRLVVQCPPRHSKTYHVSERFPAEMPCRVTVILTSGRRFALDRCDYPGFHTRACSWEDATEKFRDIKWNEGGRTLAKAVDEYNFVRVHRPSAADAATRPQHRGGFDAQGAARGQTRRGR